MNQEKGRGDAILVVDDEPQLLRLLTRVLERTGSLIYSAANAEQAMAVFNDRHREIGLAVLDVNIPPSGVGALLESMLELRENLPVIMTSGDALSSELSDRLRACRGIFLRKPFSPKAVLRATQQALGEEGE